MQPSDFLQLVRDLSGDTLPEAAYVIAYDLLFLDQFEDKRQYRDLFVNSESPHAEWELEEWQSDFLRRLLLLIAAGRSWPPGWALTLLARAHDRRAIAPVLAALESPARDSVTVDERLGSLRYLGHFLEDRRASEIMTCLRTIAGAALEAPEVVSYARRLLERAE